MKNTFFLSGWVTSAILVFVMFINMSSQRETQIVNKKLRETVAKSIPNLIQATKTARDSSFKWFKEDSISFQKKVQKDTSNVLSKADTVNINLRKIIAKDKKDYDLAYLKKNDTIKYLNSEISKINTRNKVLESASVNVNIQRYEPGRNYSLLDSTNATIYAKAIKKSSNQSIFSPQKNYLRIYNARPGGFVNNEPFFDYEQTNDEINQLLFQARASQNIGTGQFSIGGGLELKLNRTGINGAVFFNPWTNRKPTLTIGIRQDVYRIKFN